MIFEGVLQETGEVVSIDDVPSGLKCNCICPNCHVRLIAKKGKKNVHHFAHVNGAECLLSKKKHLKPNSYREELLEQPEERTSTYNCEQINIKNKQKIIEKHQLTYIAKNHKCPFIAKSPKTYVLVMEKIKSEQYDFILKGKVVWINNSKGKINFKNKPITTLEYTNSWIWEFIKEGESL